jgi:Cys-tRNA(Pro)/Cys-tRNA(Cys) deacylase
MHSAVIERDEDTGFYVAYVPGFPGAHSQGATVDEAERNLLEVIAMLREDEQQPESQAAPPGSMSDRIVATLAASGAAYTLHEHAPSVTIQDADAYLGFPVERLLKTIAFRVKNRGWVLAGLCGYAQVDYKKLAAACGVSRDKIVRLEAAEVEQELGYELGGVAPFAPNEQTAVLLDAGALGWKTIFCGTGRRDRTLAIAPRDLARVAGAQVAPLAKKTVCEG